MLIRTKLNFLVLGLVLSMVLGIAFFAIVLFPALEMQSEKSSLQNLDTKILELRSEVLKLGVAPVSEQVKIIVKSYTDLTDQFQELSGMNALMRDPEIKKSLDIVTSLYDLFDSQYKKLEEFLGPFEAALKGIFFTANVELDGIVRSTSERDSDDNTELLRMVDKLYGIITLIDYNLTSSHMMVNEQFAIIDEKISGYEMNAYIIGGSVILILSIAVTILSFITAARIARNVLKADSGVELISRGDLTVRFDINSKDELNTLGNNLNSLGDILGSVFSSMKSGASKGVELKEELIASANETSAASQQISTNSESIKKQVNNLSEMIAGARLASETLVSTIKSLGGYIEEQVSMVEESTSSVTEMISSINNVAEITAKKQIATEGLVKTAESGGQKLMHTTSIINEITSNLDEIKNTAGIIQRISSQTNLLAMNAAIEAAHAGDAGHGFAVVADEIRKLAEASSLNSKQISGVLKEVVERIEKASEAGAETMKAFGDIDSEVKGVSQSLQEISMNMAELNTGGTQILEAMSMLQDVSVRVRSGGEDMNGASDKMGEAVETVSRVASEVSDSAEEINAGINEISRSMLALSGLAENLGEITDSLEADADKFKTV